MEALAREANRDSTLTAWFKLNVEYELKEQRGVDLHGAVDSRTLYYYQIPQYFTYVKSTTAREWRPRKRGTRQIGRMYMSFEHLRTVEGVIHPSFIAAARALDLLHDDANYEACMEEAIQFEMPSELRSLFSYMLAFCEITNPQEFYDLFKASMAEDFVHSGLSESAAEASLYYNLFDRLCLLHCGISQLIVSPTPHRPDAPVEVDWEWHSRKRQGMYNSLNERPQAAADRILSSSNTHRKLHYVDGPGGSRKTFLYNAVYHVLK
ncbi:hypothetical protein OESDEN_12624 [Oesophagostomum dentatum]|uniref:ATP-dependent DNA helicase n=1 Tax=Oesophagostomum dentatum TaxID=61180 RepID=A0A0B1SRN4_OESDE|nr:hypothetical protein OESDEN_12624 [Oesophagostomum dentatum]